LVGHLCGWFRVHWAPNYASPSGYTDSYTPNGLNRYTSARGATPTYTDNRGNMTWDGSKTYSYDYSNRLLTASGSPGATLSYDPASRLYEVAGSTTVRFVYDGAVTCLVSSDHR
jgi:hypothetical protein